MSFAEEEEVNVKYRVAVTVARKRGYTQSNDHVLHS